jgi:hypothetical protein
MNKNIGEGYNQPSPELGVDLMAIIYFLYKNRGCPMGDTPEGVQAWYRACVYVPFEEWASKQECDE